MVVQVNNARRDLDGKDYEGEGSEAGLNRRRDARGSRVPLFDNLAGVERHGQPNAEELRGIRGTWPHTPSNWDYRSAWICRSCGAAL